MYDLLGRRLAVVDHPKGCVGCLERYDYLVILRKMDLLPTLHRYCQKSLKASSDLLWDLPQIAILFLYMYVPACKRQHI